MNNLFIKPVQRKAAITTLLIPCFAVLVSCVTINIYFPAAAAEKAAEKIVDEVWQIKDDTKANVAPAPAKPEAK